MIEIVPASSLPDELLLGAVNQSFERAPKSLDWFRWKHRSGPWGASVGHAAVDDDRVVGVRLFVPWRVTDAHGEGHRILRAMDGAVVPSARRQGLFSRLIGAQLDSIPPGEDAPMAVYSTSVPASRDAYLKLGWTIFDVRHRVVPPPVSFAAVTRHTWPEIPEYVQSRSEGALTTSWSQSALAWRTDPRSGNTYSVFSLTEADSPNGIVVRRARLGRIPVAVIVHSWGRETDRRSLAGASARILRCAALWYTHQMPELGRLAWQRGGSTVSLWTRDPDVRSELSAPSAWAFTFADLEGVM